MRLLRKTISCKLQTLANNFMCGIRKLQGVGWCSLSRMGWLGMRSARSSSPHQEHQQLGMQCQQQLGSVHLVCSQRKALLESLPQHLQDASSQCRNRPRLGCDQHTLADISLCNPRSTGGMDQYHPCCKCVSTFQDSRARS